MAGVLQNSSVDVDALCARARGQAQGAGDRIGTRTKSCVDATGLEEAHLSLPGRRGGGEARGRDGEDKLREHRGCQWRVELHV